MPSVRVSNVTLLRVCERANCRGRLSGPVILQLEVELLMNPTDMPCPWRPHMMSAHLYFGFSELTAHHVVYVLIERANSGRWLAKLAEVAPDKTPSTRSWQHRLKLHRFWTFCTPTLLC